MAQPTSRQSPPSLTPDDGRPQELPIRYRMPNFRAQTPPRGRAVEPYANGSHKYKHTYQGGGSAPPSRQRPNGQPSWSRGQSPGGGGARAVRGSRAAASQPFAPPSPLPIVASEIIVNDKVLATPSPVRALAVSRHLVWMSLANGGCEVRNARTGEVVLRFAGGGGGGGGGGTASPNAPSAARDSRVGSMVGAVRELSKSAAASPNLVIESMLSVVTRAGEPQVWLGLSNGTVEVHHAESAVLVATLKKHLGRVTAMAEFGGLVYTGGSDQQIAQWRLEGCGYVRAFMGAHAHTGDILCMYAEGNALVTGSMDDTVKVWDVGTGDMQLTGYFHAGAGGVTALCRVAQAMWSGDHAGQLVRWDLVTGEAIAMTRPHTARITALRRAGTRVYSGSADGTLAILSAETGEPLKRIADQSGGWLTAIAYPAQLSRFVVWSADAAGCVRCWYHDEFNFTSRDFEQLSDETWYRSGTTPYGELRQSIAGRNARLREQLAAAELRDARAVAILRQCGDAIGGGGARDAARQLARLQDQMRMVEDRRARTAQDLQRSREELAQVDRDVAATLALLQSTQADLNALSAGYGNRLAALLPTTAGGAAADPAATATAPGVAVTGLPGVGVGSAPTPAPPSTATATAPVAVPVSLPANPMLPPPPLTVTAPSAAVPPPPPVLPPSGVPAVYPLPPLGAVGGAGGAVGGVAPGLGMPGIASTAGGVVGSPAAGGVGGGPAVGGVGGGTAAGGLVGGVVGGTAAGGGVGGVTTGAAAVPAAGLPSATPAAVGVGGLVPVGQGLPTGVGVGGGTTAAVPLGIGAGPPPPPPPPPGTAAITTLAPGPAVPGMPASTVPGALSHAEQVRAMLAALAATGGGTLGGGQDTVTWTNPNVGNYIQRRYYGASPSLRAPDIARRERRRGRMPVVKVVPLTRAASAEPAAVKK